MDPAANRIGTDDRGPGPMPGPNLDWRRQWNELTGPKGLAGKRLSEVGSLLVSLVTVLPSEFRTFMTKLVGAAEDALTNPKTRPPGQDSGEIFPLPYTFISAEELPRRVTVTSKEPVLRRVRTSWILLLVASLNFEFYGGDSRKASLLTFGPATLAQRAALVRLGCSADVICELNPGTIAETDWGPRLKAASVSYDGSEIAIAESMTFDQISPGLPPLRVWQRPSP